MISNFSVVSLDNFLRQEAMIQERMTLIHRLQVQHHRSKVECLLNPQRFSQAKVYSQPIFNQFSCWEPYQTKISPVFGVNNQLPQVERINPYKAQYQSPQLNFHSLKNAISLPLTVKESFSLMNKDSNFKLQYQKPTHLSSPLQSDCGSIEKIGVKQEEDKEDRKTASESDVTVEKVSLSKKIKRT